MQTRKSSLKVTPTTFAQELNELACC